MASKCFDGKNQEYDGCPKDQLALVLPWRLALCGHCYTEMVLR